MHLSAAFACVHRNGPRAARARRLARTEGRRPGGGVPAAGRSAGGSGRLARPARRQGCKPSAEDGPGPGARVFGPRVTAGRALNPPYERGTRGAKRPGHFPGVGPLVHGIREPEAVLADVAPTHAPAGPRGSELLAGGSGSPREPPETRAPRTRTHAQRIPLSQARPPLPMVLTRGPRRQTDRQTDRPWPRWAGRAAGPGGTAP